MAGLGATMTSDAHCIVSESILSLRGEAREHADEGPPALVVSTARDRDWDLTKQALEAGGPGPFSFALGVHPWFLRPETFETDLAELGELLEKYPEARVGEIGLDKARRGLAVTLEDQKQAFIAQFELAAERRRSVSIHVVRAHGSLLELLRMWEASMECFPRGIYLHSWSGSAQITKDILRLERVGRLVWFGFSWKINGTRIDESLSAIIPRDRILLESDLSYTEQERQSELLLMSSHLEKIFQLSLREANNNFHRFLNLGNDG